MIEMTLLLLALYGVIDGAIWMIRNELARRRVRRMVWPPMQTLAISDEIPF